MELERPIGKGFAHVVNAAMDKTKHGKSNKAKKISSGSDSQFSGTKKLSTSSDHQVRNQNDILTTGKRPSIVTRMNSDQTEMIFPTGNSQRRHAFNSHFMGSLDEDEPLPEVSSDDSVRSCNSLTTGGGGGNRRTPPPVKVRARKLDGQPSFKTKEPLYMVDLAGDQLICRKRASSLTNQDEMTENERKLFQFMQERLGGRLGGQHRGSSSFWTRRQVSRVYTNESLIVDPRMSSFSFEGLFEKNPDGTFANRFKSDTKRYLTPMVLPPIYSSKPTQLRPRDFSKPLPPQRPLTRAEWADFKHIRYLRPKAKRFQTSSEMEYPYMWK